MLQFGLSVAKLRIYVAILNSIQCNSLFLSAVEKENHVDIIICGGGASGLLLANGLVKDPAFDQLNILLLEKDKKTLNDRTWCFWEEDEGEWESLVHDRWDNALFNAPNFSDRFPMRPYQYKMIRSLDFYQAIYPRLEEALNVKIVQAEVTDIDPGDEYCLVKTDNTTYRGDKVFSSLPQDHFTKQQKYPVLQQHFIGWFVQTEQPIFDPSTMVFMDFDLPQKEETRFMYVLPFSEKEALIEYTLFSKDLLEKAEYENAMIDYLNEKQAGEYTITEKEQGSIPMTAYDFSQHNKANLMHIGTAGGWTKASTGFTFQKSQRKINALIQHLKQERSLLSFPQRSKFDFYDLLFLDVLAKYNAEGGKLFTRMFRYNSPQRIFAFLDERTSFLQEARLMVSFPIGRFVSALVKRLF